MPLLVCMSGVLWGSQAGARFINSNPKSEILESFMGLVQGVHQGRLGRKDRNLHWLVTVQAVNLVTCLCAVACVSVRSLRVYGPLACTPTTELLRNEGPLWSEYMPRSCGWNTCQGGNPIGAAQPNSQQLITAFISFIILLHHHHHYAVYKC